MTDEIVVSILCLCYNHEPFIRDCLDGILMQKTNFKFEVIIHDDASTDKSASIIKEYEEKYPDIIKPIYQTENQYSKGVNISKTFLHPRVKGKYIAVCECDDYWVDSEKLQKQYDFLETHPECVGCVGGAKIIYYANNNPPTYNFPTEKSRYVTTEEALLYGSGYPTATFFFRASQLTENDISEGLKLSFGDYVRILNLALHGKIYSFHEVFSVYRYGVPGSWTVRISKNINQLISDQEQRIILFDRFNDATNNVFKSVTEQRLIDIQFSILLAQGNKKELKKQPYRNMYIKKYGIIAKIKSFLAVRFPFLLKINRTFKKKENKIVTK